MRRILGFCATVVLALTGLLVVVATPAGAYPVDVCAQLQVSTTRPHPGQSITVSGTAFVAGDHLTLELRPPTVVVGHATVEANGTFSTSIRIPSDVQGSRLLYAVGSTSSCPVDPEQLTISAGVAGVETSRAASGSSAGSGGLASTGVKILAALLLAAGLIGLGVALTRGGRPERAAGRHAA